MSMMKLRHTLLNTAYGSAALIMLGLSGVVLGGILVLIHNMWVSIHPIVATLFCLITLVPLSYYIGNTWIKLTSPISTPANTFTAVQVEEQVLLDNLVSALVSLNEVYADSADFSLEELAQQTELALESFNTYCVHRINNDSTFLDKVTGNE